MTSAAGWHLPQPDWLQHRLTVCGAADEVAGFCRQASGSGVVPWWQDHDRLAEDWFHLLLEAPPERRTVAPVPRAILRLGADDPASLAWLWRHWGTTWPLRRVEALAPTDAELARCEAGEAVFCCGFWLADWTPWPVISGVRARWPALRVSVVPLYDAMGVELQIERKTMAAPLRTRAASG